MNTFSHLLIVLACIDFVFVFVSVFSQLFLIQMQTTNTFNHLLIVLACIDNIFLVLTILDYSSARGYFFQILFKEI